MSDELGFGLDRRDFMMATIASVGASAVLAANTGAANAQGTTVPGAAGSAQVAPQGTVYTSVMVAKGAKPGKRVALIGGVHGDEISPVHTIQTVMSQLNPAEMSGTVMAILDVSRPALEGMARRWPNSGRGIDLIDINREWPGNENGASAPNRHAGLLFNRLFRPNAAC